MPPASRSPHDGSSSGSGSNRKGKVRPRDGPFAIPASSVEVGDGNRPDTDLRHTENAIDWDAVFRAIGGSSGDVNPGGTIYAPHATEAHGPGIVTGGNSDDQAPTYLWKEEERAGVGVDFEGFAQLSPLAAPSQTQVGPSRSHPLIPPTYQTKTTSTGHVGHPTRMSFDDDRIPLSGPPSVPWSEIAFPQQHGGSSSSRPLDRQSFSTTPESFTNPVPEAGSSRPTTLRTHSYPVDRQLGMFESHIGRQPFETLAHQSGFGSDQASWSNNVSNTVQDKTQASSLATALIDYSQSVSPQQQLQSSRGVGFGPSRLPPMDVETLSQSHFPAFSPRLPPQYMLPGIDIPSVPPPAPFSSPVNFVDSAAHSAPVSVTATPESSYRSNLSTPRMSQMLSDAVPTSSSTSNGALQASTQTSGSSKRPLPSKKGGAPGRTAPRLLPPSVPPSQITPEVSSDSGPDAEDKRVRNTVASAKFRAKKKQHVATIQRTISDLEAQQVDLEADVANLRQENGLLREMVQLKFGMNMPPSSS